MTSPFAILMASVLVATAQVSSALYHPLPTYKLCKATGDPHYTTFDGKTYHYQGRCTYMLTSTCPCSKLDPIQVRVKQQPCPPWAPNTCVFEVIINYSNHDGSWKISFKNGGQIRVNNVLTSVPPTYEADGFEVTRPGGQMQFRTWDGFTVRYNGIYNVYVTIPCKYFDEMCGLCGDADGNPLNDFEKPDGDIVVSANEFGNSWQVWSWPLCNPWLADEWVTPNGLTEAQFEERVDAATPASGSACGLLRDPVFAKCWEKLTPTEQQEIQKSCLWDQLAAPHNPDAACHVLDGFIEDCRQRGFSFTKEWPKEPCLGFNACGNHDCKNEASCEANRQKELGYECSCPDGFRGTLCDERVPIDPCQDVICPRGQSCRPNPTAPNGYVCEGTNPCLIVRCANGEICQPRATSPGGFECVAAIFRAPGK